MCDDLSGRLSDRERLKRKLNQVLGDSLRHGFFSFKIRGSRGKKGRREIGIHAGNSYRFVIAEEELGDLLRQRATPVTVAPGEPTRSGRPPSVRFQGRVQEDVAVGLGLRQSEVSLESHSSFTAETVAFWLEHSQRDLTEEDAREATANVVGFFTPSNEWRETMSDAGRASSSTSDARRDTW
jgi:hypothetical protein